MAKRPIKAVSRELVEMPVNGAEDAPENIPHVDAILVIANTTIDRAVVAKKPEYALNFIKGAFNTRHVSDISAIQSCYETERRWNEFGIEGDFIDYARDDVGKGAETIRRYSKIGKMMNEVAPKEYRATLWCRPIRNLIAIAQAVDEHGDFTHDEWHVLSRCINGQEVRLKLEEFLAKKRKPTNRLTITLDREGGLTASKRNKKEPIGMLRLEPGNDLVAEAVQRIIASAGILEM